MREEAKAKVFIFLLQYRHLIPAPVNRTTPSASLYKHSLITCQKDNPSTPMTHVACESKLRSVARSSMHPDPRNCVATGLAVVYHTFSAGIKRRHCIMPGSPFLPLSLPVFVTSNWPCSFPETMEKRKFGKTE